MHFAEILMFAGLFVSAVTALTDFFLLSRKLRVRRKFVDKLSTDPEFLQEVLVLRKVINDEQKYLEEIEHVKALIEKEMAELSERERAQIRAPLYQPSPVGRKRYIERLIDAATSAPQHI